MEATLRLEERIQLWAPRCIIFARIDYAALTSTVMA